MSDEYTPILEQQTHTIHRIDPTVTIQRKYKLLLWSSTVILVRHAEPTSGTNPSLSAAGQARANLLHNMLQDEDLSAVFVTDTLRSAQTGQPTATDQGLALTNYAAADGAALAHTIRTGHAGRTVLVMAHSNTVDDIAGTLGVPGIGELAENQFDRMFIIARNWCGARLTRLRYGAVTA